MARTRRFWLKRGGRRPKVPIGAPFFEEDAAPPDRAYRAPSPEEEAESLARWKAEQLRQVNRVAPTAGELSTVAIMAAALLALMRMERASPLDEAGQDGERLAGVEGGSRVEQSVSPLFAGLSAEDGGPGSSPSAAGSSLADAGAGGTILGPFRSSPGTAGLVGPLAEDRLDGMTLRAATAEYLAGAAAPGAALATSAVSPLATDADVRLATALPTEAGADRAPTDAPSTTERARQVEAERLGDSSADSAVPQPAPSESVWTQLTWQWQLTAPSSSPGQPDQARPTSPSALVEGPRNGLPEASQAPARSEESAMPPVFAAGQSQQTPQDAPGNSGNAPAFADGVSRGLAKQEDGSGDSESPPVLANLLPLDVGKDGARPSDSESASGPSDLLPPGLAKHQDASDAPDDGHLAALPPGLAKDQEAGDVPDDGLLAGLPPGLAKDQEAGDVPDDGHLAALPPGLAKDQEAGDVPEDGLLAALPPGLAKHQEASDAPDDGHLAALPPGLAKHQEAGDAPDGAHLAALPPGLAQHQEASDAPDVGPLAALPPGLAKHQEADDAPDDAHLAALPPGLAMHPEAGDAPDDAHLAVLPPGLAKHPEAGEEEGYGQLLAALSPGQQRQNERAAAQLEDGDHPGHGLLHDDVVFVPPGHERGGREDTGPHVPVDPLPDPTLFSAVPAATDAIL